MKFLIAGFALLLAGHSVASADPADTRFEAIEDGAVVLDRETGLQWMRCSMGQKWTGTACAGLPNRYTWDQAINLESDLAGNDSWRLPTVGELQTLVEYRVFNPAINPEAFPNTPPANYWSSSEAAYDAFYAWSVHFANGFSNWRHKRQRFEARLVRDAD
ncbi:DUF1566 domain-containing protein [Thioalkalivibrio sp.]|uniref:Lcl C-terminal domain-containing protein n=1 Tax=Thioalkalivibrio sp. TaxID=2093813 RepID=UPI0012D5EABD|nr:DUF1566 domain-containing protein [Thioalkalivibrio sp.]TVP80733.1 MAG: DUF1566 domain-containing protein [Thioalkalivibrio sp.]